MAGYGYWHLKTNRLKKGFPPIEEVERLFEDHTNFISEEHEMIVRAGALSRGDCVLKISSLTSDPQTRAAFIAELEGKLIDI